MNMYKSLGRRKVVLVAEDNSTNVMILVKMLEKLGCQALVVSDGVEAVDALRHADPDVILMDINMPRMDGIAAAREIRRLGLAPRAPIIAVTAKPMPSDLRELAELNIDDVVTKPIRLAHLSEAIDKWAK